jgi:hypothetical protein
VVVELVQHLIEILSEKMSELTTFTQWYQPSQQFASQQQQQILPVEWLLVSSNEHSPAAMLELFDVERKLVEMKGLALASVHYMHLSERLVELEQFVHAIESVQKRERCVEKIRSLKRMVEEHVQAYQPSFVTVPEQFFAHQQKYEKMCQLVGELECHFIEQITNNTTTTGQVNMPSIYNGQVNMLPSIYNGQVSPVTVINGEFQPPRFVGLQLVHAKFLRLVQEFQIQFPECFSAKIEALGIVCRQKKKHTPLSEGYLDYLNFYLKRIMIKMKIIFHKH